MQNVRLDARGDPDLALERPAVEARQHGDAQAERPRDREIAGGLRRRVGGGAGHRQATARVDVSMKTPRRVASRTARPTVFGMSWSLRARKTRHPRLRAVAI